MSRPIRDVLGAIAVLVGLAAPLVGFFWGEWAISVVSIPLVVIGFWAIVGGPLKLELKMIGFGFNVEVGKEG